MDSVFICSGFAHSRFFSPSHAAGHETRWVTYTTFTYSCDCLLCLTIANATEAKVHIPFNILTVSQTCEMMAPYVLIHQHTSSCATEYHQFHYASPGWIQGLLCHSFFGSFLKIWQIRQHTCISERRILLRFTRRLMRIVSGKFPQWNCDQKSECLFFSMWLLGWVIVFPQLWWKVLTRSNL